MRILLRLLLCCVPLGSLLGQPATTLTVKITHPAADTLSVDVYPDWVAQRMNVGRTYHFPVKEGKAVTQQIDIREPAYLGWRYGKKPPESPCWSPAMQ